jgi:hypothetical protein
MGGVKVYLTLSKIGMSNYAMSTFGERAVVILWAVYPSRHKVRMDSTREP